MTVARTFDAAGLNAVAAKADIASDIGVAEGEEVSFDAVCEQSDRHIVVTNGVDAWMIAEFVSPAVYRCHSIFDTTCRGRAAVQAGKLLVKWMWDNTTASMLIGATPIENRKARLFNRWVGFSSDGLGMCFNPLRDYEAEWFHVCRPPLIT
jgi:hypothetical protein